MASFPPRPPPPAVQTPPLQRSAYLGKLDQLKRLVKQVEIEHKGERIGKVLGKLMDGNGCSVLHMAAVNGKTQICKYLIKDLDVNVDVRDKRESTPLLQATLGGQFSTAQYLLHNGANPNAACVEGFAPLHFAAKKGFKKLVKLLVSRGSEVNAMSPNGTPLQIAAGEGRIDCVKILLDKHADPNAFYQPSSTEIYHRVYSPLKGAIYANSLECVKLLLQAGADPNVCSPLEVAIGEERTEFIECLLAAGADPNARNAHDLTPVEVAAIKGRREAVLLLFPATAPIAEVTDWSPDGIMKYVHTDEATRKRMKKREEVFSLTKPPGKAGHPEVRERIFIEAVSHYTTCSLIMDTSAAEASPSSNKHVVWSMMIIQQGLNDIRAWRTLSPDWEEGETTATEKEDFTRAPKMFSWTKM